MEAWTAIETWTGSPYATSDYLGTASESPYICAYFDDITYASTLTSVTLVEVCNMTTTETWQGSVHTTTISLPSSSVETWTVTFPGATETWTVTTTSTIDLSETTPAVLGSTTNSGSGESGDCSTCLSRFVSVAPLQFHFSMHQHHHQHGSFQPAIKNGPFFYHLQPAALLTSIQCRHHRRPCYNSATVY